MAQTHQVFVYQPVLPNDQVLWSLEHFHLLTTNIISFILANYLDVTKTAWVSSLLYRCCKCKLGVFLEFT